MKKLISNYTFNAAARTVALNDYAAVDLEGLLLITNVTDNIIVYNFADPTRGGGINSNVITLAYDTTTMSNSDALQIYYDDGSTAASELSLQALGDAVDYLKMITNQTKVLSTQDGAQRQRVAVEAMPPVTISGTPTVIGTVTANTQSVLGEITARQESSRMEFAQGIRSNLVF
jgi:hypothetical protein